MKYADSVTRTFQQYSSPEWRNAYANAAPGKFVDYQDPTYLGFYVKFYGLGPDGTGERPIGDTGNFVPLDEFPGGLFYHEDHPDSAIRYLKNIGEYTRAQMLREFVMGMKKLSDELPWYFVKVSGLDAIWQIKKADSFRGKDLKLAFELLESIDLKVTYLMDLYRKAAFDSVYMRWMLPQNLRTFEMDLVITEIRSMQRPAPLTSNDPSIAMDDSSDSFRNRLRTDASSLTTAANVPGLSEAALQNFIADNVPNTQAASTLSNAVISAAGRDFGAYSSYPILMRNFNELATFLVFNFSQCEFEPWEEAPPYLSTVGKTAETMATGKMTISTPIVREFNTYGLLGAVLEDTMYNTSRTKSEAEKLFPAGAGGNANSATVPASELGYLEGIKKEGFNLSKQTSNQRNLRGENAGGFAGQLLEGIGNTVAAAATSGLQSTLARNLLGNVFQNAFEPKVAQDIANKVVLESPEIIQKLLGEVALSSYGAEVEGAPQPKTADLIAPPKPQSAPANVTLVSPEIKTPESSKVEFESVTQNNIGSGKVDLQAPPTGPVLSAKVDFESTGATLAGSTGKAELSGIGSLDGNTGKVDLESGNTKQLIGSTGKAELSGIGSLDGALSKTELVSPPISESASGSVDLIAPPLNTDAATSVNLTAPPTTAASSSNVNLVEPPVSESTNKNVELTSPSTNESPSSKVELQGQGTLEGASSNVELETPPVSTNTISTISLVAPPVSANGSSNVELEAPPVNSAGGTRIELEEPPKAIAASANVNLEAAPQSNTAATKTSLTPPPISETDPGSVELTATRTAENVPGAIELTAPKKESEAVNRKVDLQASPISKAELDNVNLESAPVQNPVLGKDVLFGADGSLSGSTGSVKLDSPPSSIVDMGTTRLESPPGQLDIDNIGNADLQEP